MLWYGFCFMFAFRQIHGFFAGRVTNCDNAHHFFIFIWLDLNYVRIYLNKLVTHPLARKLVLHTRKRPGKYPPRSIIVESSQREHLIWYDYEFWPHPLPGGIKERGTCWYRNKTHTCRRGCAFFDKKMSISLSRIVICQPSKGGDIITNL